MMGLVEQMKKWEVQRAERARALQQSQRQIVRFLRSQGARLVVLFGLAIRRTGPFSDLDLMVVMPDDRPSSQWQSKLYREAPLTVATDMLVYNESDFREMRDSSRFVQHILETGRVIHEAVSE